MVRQRAQRRDPSQEAILRGKDELNERTTDVIKRLIDVKRKWNGNTEPKFKLTDPMPDEIVGEGGSILNDLGEIMNNLRQVDQMQDEYAETRGRRISERMQQMEQIQAEVLRAGITKNASNRLTRMWSHIVAPFGSENGKQDRLRMLRALARIDYNLRDVEDKVLSGDPAIFDALYLAKQLWLDAKGSFFEEYRKNLKELLDTAITESRRLSSELPKTSPPTPPPDIPKTTPLRDDGGPVIPDSGQRGSTTDVQREKAVQNQLTQLQQEEDEAIRGRLKKTPPIIPDSEISAHPELGTPSTSEVQEQVSSKEQEQRDIANRAVIRRRNLMSTDQLLDLYLDIKSNDSSRQERMRQEFLNTLTDENRDALNERIDLLDLGEEEDEDSEEWLDLFDQFVYTKKQLGESTDNLYYDSFANNLRNRREAYMKHDGVEDVEFTISIKDGKVEIVGTPIKTEIEAPISGPPEMREFSLMDYDNKLKVIEQMLEDEVPEEAVQALNLYSGEKYSLKEVAQELDMIEEGEDPSREILEKVSKMIEIAQRNFIEIAKEMGVFDEEEDDEDIPDALEEEDDFTEKEEEEYEPDEEDDEPEPEPEVGVPEPEPELQEQDPVELQRALRTFILDNISYWYTDTRDYISTLTEIPNPWNVKLQQLWSTLNNRINRVRASRGDAEWTRNYLLFLKSVGDVRAVVDQVNTELSAKEMKPDFEFGVTIDDTQLENHAREFVKQYQKDLEKFIEENYSSRLVSQASNPISRWWKRMQTNLGWSRDKSIRLMVDRHIRNARKNLQSMLDNLEKRHINFRSLIRDSEEFYNSFIQVYDKLADLAEAYNARMRIEKSEKKQQQGKMMYEIIPNSDIYALRNIAKGLQSDKKAIDTLNDIESTVSEMQSTIDSSGEI